MIQVTDPSKEMFPVVNEKDEVIGEISRNEAHKNPNIIHRCAGVFVFNPRGEFLLQKRSKTKDTFPDCWDISVGGHVGLGEQYLKAALRETEEELGIAVEEKQLRFLGKLLIQLPWEQEFWCIYQYDLPDDSQISSSDEEVSKTAFVSLPKLQMMLSDIEEKWSDKAKQQLQTLLFSDS
jgi:isopentenyl-diphosphate delta-isomerase